MYVSKGGVSRCRNGEKVNVMEPFFNRYIFVKLNDQFDDWRPIRSTEKPAWIPDDLIIQLKENGNSDGLQNVGERILRAGDKVALLNGSFAGYQGIFQKQKKILKELLCCSILGRSNSVVMCKGDLQRVE